MKPIIGLILILLTNSATAGTLKPFQSDSCSAFPDGTMKQQELWLAILEGLQSIDNRKTEGS